ncbi:MAG: hypothetical protein SGI74_08025 [Oligoflexia bacterium]|nr:hypothetical protein [Oligoflexia bacterium]
MFNRTSKIISALLLTFAVAFVGCGQGKQVLSKPSDNTAAGPGGRGLVPGTTPIPGTSPVGGAIPTPPPISSGATASLVVSGDQNATLKDYVGGPLAQTGPAQINISVSPDSGVYLGEMHIRFYEQNFGSLILHSAAFYNGNHIDRGNNVHILTVDPTTGKPTYRIMFEDQYGMLVLLLTPVTGTDVSNMTGTVWYRNFQAAPNTNPLFNGQWNGSTWIPPNPKAYCWTGVIGPSSPYYCVNQSVPPATTGATAVKFLGTIPSIDGHAALGI